MSSGPQARGADLPRRRALAVPDLGSTATGWIVVAALLIAAGVLLYHETSGTTIWLDEWSYVLNRRGDSLASFLDPHNEHLSLIPVIIYKLLFATAGIGDYRPYRLLVIIAHLGTCALVFAYARPRVGVFYALLATVLMLLFGPGWENILWPFQIAWLISLAAGIGALLALERGDRRGDVLASLLLAISLASSGVGVAVAIGLAVEVALVRRRLQDAWIVAAPVALYALWWIGYQQTMFERHAIVLAPGFAADGAGASIAALAGLGGSIGFDTAGSLPNWGPALLLLGLAITGWHLVRLGRLPARVASLAAMVVSFWLLAAVSRSSVVGPYASRYLYVGALFVVLLAVELARGVRARGWLGALAGLLAVGAIVSNLGTLRDEGRLVRSQGQITAADLGALQIGRPVVPPGYEATELPGAPLVVLPAAAYFAAARDLGTPAASPATIAADPEGVRFLADGELIHLHGVAPSPAGAGLVPTGTPPAVDSFPDGRVRDRGACVLFAPNRFTSGATTPTLEVTIPPGGLELDAVGAPATVAVRRFADQFQAIGTLAPGGPATLKIASDLSSRPWHLSLAAPGGAAACGLS